MLNYEKHRKEIFNQKNKPALCYVYEKILKMDCHDTVCVDCNNIALKFLFSEAKEKIKLTKAEYCILKNIDPKYQWIARDKNNRIWLYEEKPFKDDDEWSAMESSYFDVFNHLFKFIKWEDEEPHNIQELLNNCEVKEDVHK